MNKGGVGLGGEAAGGCGPTAAAAAAAAQKQKALLPRVDTDIGNLVDNFGFLVNVARLMIHPYEIPKKSFMMEMCAARMARDITSRFISAKAYKIPHDTSS
ncbi:hypothetical protein CDL12_06738 [Handroanthus impetiginosus]|uniref:Uncharacterized protein n=1 Tax=Handroanthus impetiginosus TaxID=429701 RepID=A0A2G9HTD9_9LAMI|nr:hypothetical protein CDL12_06738 [Handroanthus impetiginosus]